MQHSAAPGVTMVCYAYWNEPEVASRDTVVVGLLNSSSGRGLTKRVIHINQYLSGRYFFSRWKKRSLRRRYGCNKSQTPVKVGYTTTTTLGLVTNGWNGESKRREQFKSRKFFTLQRYRSISSLGPYVKQWLRYVIRCKQVPKQHVAVKLINDLWNHSRLDYFLSIWRKHSPLCTNTNLVIYRATLKADQFVQGYNLSQALQYWKYTSRYRHFIKKQTFHTWVVHIRILRIFNKYHRVVLSAGFMQWKLHALRAPAVEKLYLKSLHISQCLQVWHVKAAKLARQRQHQQQLQQHFATQSNRYSDSNKETNMMCSYTCLYLHYSTCVSLHTWISTSSMKRAERIRTHQACLFRRQFIREICLQCFHHNSVLRRHSILLTLKATRFHKRRILAEALSLLVACAIQNQRIARNPTKFSHFQLNWTIRNAYRKFVYHHTEKSMQLSRMRKAVIFHQNQRFSELRVLHTLLPCLNVASSRKDTIYAFRTRSLCISGMFRWKNASIFSRKSRIMHATVEKRHLLSRVRRILWIRWSVGCIVSFESFLTRARVQAKVLLQAVIHFKKRLLLLAMKKLYVFTRTQVQLKRSCRIFSKLHSFPACSLARDVFNVWKIEYLPYVKRLRHNIEHVKAKYIYYTKRSFFELWFDKCAFVLLKRQVMRNALHCLCKERKRCLEKRTMFLSTVTTRAVTSVHLKRIQHLQHHHEEHRVSAEQTQNQRLQLKFQSPRRSQLSVGCKSPKKATYAINLAYSPLVCRPQLVSRFHLDVKVEQRKAWTRELQELIQQQRKDATNSDVFDVSVEITTQRGKFLLNTLLLAENSLLSWKACMRRLCCYDIIRYWRDTYVSMSKAQHAEIVKNRMDNMDKTVRYATCVQMSSSMGEKCVLRYCITCWRTPIIARNSILKQRILIRLYCKSFFLLWIQRRQHNFIYRNLVLPSKPNNVNIPVSLLASTSASKSVCVRVVSGTTVVVAGTGASTTTAHMNTTVSVPVPVRVPPLKVKTIPTSTCLSGAKANMRGRMRSSQCVQGQAQDVGMNRGRGLSTYNQNHANWTKTGTATVTSIVKCMHESDSKNNCFDDASKKYNPMTKSSTSSMSVKQQAVADKENNTLVSMTTKSMRTRGKCTDTVVGKGKEKDQCVSIRERLERNMHRALQMERQAKTHEHKHSVKCKDCYSTQSIPVSVPVSGTARPMALHGIGR